MEGMITDLTLGRENQANFEDYLRDNSNVKPGIDLSVTVLTTGFWPSYKSLGLNLPIEMGKSGKNKVSGAKQTMGRTSGSKSYARAQKDFKKMRGGFLYPLSFSHFTLTKKDNSWIGEPSQEKVSMDNSLQSRIEDGAEDSEELPTQVYAVQMGPEIEFGAMEIV